MKKIWQKLILIFTIIIIIFNVSSPILNSVQAVDWKEDIFFGPTITEADSTMGTAMGVIDGIVRYTYMDT